MVILKLNKCYFFIGSIDYLRHVTTTSHRNSSLYIQRSQRNKITKKHYRALLTLHIAECVSSMRAQLCTHRGPAKSEIKKDTTDVLCCFTGGRAGGNTRTAGQTGFTINDRVLIGMRPLHLGFWRLQRPSWMCTTTIRLLGRNIRDGYWSRSLKTAKNAGYTTQRELPAIVWSVLTLLVYLEDPPCKIRTDRNSLKTI